MQFPGNLADFRMKLVSQVTGDKAKQSESAAAQAMRKIRIGSGK